MLLDYFLDNALFGHLLSRSASSDSMVHWQFSVFTTMCGIRRSARQACGSHMLDAFHVVVGSNSEHAKRTIPQHNIAAVAAAAESASGRCPSRRTVPKPSFKRIMAQLNPPHGRNTDLNEGSRTKCIDSRSMALPAAHAGAHGLEPQQRQPKNGGHLSGSNLGKWSQF